MTAWLELCEVDLGDCRGTQRYQYSGILTPLAGTTGPQRCKMGQSARLHPPDPELLPLLALPRPTGKGSRQDGQGGFLE